jgi:hypothetical protein
MDSSVISAIAIWIIFVAGICIISEWCSFNKPSVSKIDILDQKIDDFFETMKIQMKQEFKKKFLKEDFGNTLNMHEYTHVPPQSGFKMSQDESDLITRTNEILYSRIPFDANKKIDFDTPVVKSEPSRYTPGIDSNYNFDPTYTNNIKTKYEQVKNVYSVLPSDTFSSNLFTI